MESIAERSKKLITSGTNAILAMSLAGKVQEMSALDTCDPVAILAQILQRAACRLE